jgi:hypothetical protein
LSWPLTIFHPSAWPSNAQPVTPEKILRALAKIG